MSAEPTRPPNAAIDEDLFCLTCGYNLRGLSGDPVRCPECGKHTDLGTALIPAALIRKALTDLETAPTMTVAGSLLLSAALGILAYSALLYAPPIAVFSLVGIVAGIALWAWGSATTRRACAGAPGWHHIILEFHLITFLCAGVPFLLVCVANWPGVVVVILSLAAVLLGLRRYPAARIRREGLQRDAAVRIARQTLSGAIRRQRR